MQREALCINKRAPQFYLLALSQPPFALRLAHTIENRASDLLPKYQSLFLAFTSRIYTCHWLGFQV